MMRALGPLNHSRNALLAALEVNGGVLMMRTYLTTLDPSYEYWVEVRRARGGYRRFGRKARKLEVSLDGETFIKVQPSDCLMALLPVIPSADWPGKEIGLPPGVENDSGHVCYHCRDGGHDECLGVPCSCSCSGGRPQ